MIIGEPGSPPRRRRRRWLLILSIVVPILVIPAGILFLIFGVFGEQVSGHVYATKTTLGSFQDEIDDCASGDGYMPRFFGVDLRGKAGQHLRVTGSGPSAVLEVFAHGAHMPAIVIHPEACTSWDVLVESANLRVNHVRAVSGHVHAVCQENKTGKLRVDVTFKRCGT